MKSLLLPSIGISLLSSVLFTRVAQADDPQNTYGELGTTEAEIQPGPNGRPLFAPATWARMDNNISVFGIFSYLHAAGSGVGVGLRYQKTLVPEGFIRNANIKDDLGVEGSFEFLHYSWDFGNSGWSYNEFGLGAGIVWNLWFTDQLAVYPKLGLDFRFGNWSSDTGDAEPASYTTVYLVGAAGVVYMINNISLRAELGIQALQLGVGVSL